MTYRIALFPMTVSDLQCHFHVTSLFKYAYCFVQHLSTWIASADERSVCDIHVTKHKFLSPDGATLDFLKLVCCVLSVCVSFPLAATNVRVRCSNAKITLHHEAKRALCKHTSNWFTQAWRHITHSVCVRCFQTSCTVAQEPNTLSDTAYSNASAFDLCT